jgi:hypothetical protein
MAGEMASLTAEMTPYVSAPGWRLRRSDAGQSAGSTRRWDLGRSGTLQLSRFGIGVIPHALIQLTGFD